MVMARRPEVKTAPGPVVAIDTVLLAQQMTAALGRLPFTRPFTGRSNPLSSLGANLTREMARSFMGYCSSLPIAEFRSIELLLDGLCEVVMPPVVRAFDVDHRAAEFGGVPGILYWPRRAAPRGVVLYLHGGGYIGTSPAMYGFFTARICRETECAVFVADYRLAPEFPFPAGVEDAASVLAALVELGVPTERLLMAGDSGGGGLVNSLVVATPDDDQLVRPAGLILFSPEVDLGLDEPSVSENADTDILPWNIPTAAYLHGFDASSGYVSVINADLCGFPPTCVSWGGDEMFRDPIRRFARELERAGVTTHAHEMPGMFHVFQILMPWAEESRAIYRHVRQFVETVLDRAPVLAPGALSRLYGSPGA